VQILRHLVVLLTGFIAGTRTIDAVRSWREWPLFLEDVAVVLISLALAGLVWWLLRPRAVE
jgi:hypothetical protein